VITVFRQFGEVRRYLFGCVSPFGFSLSDSARMNPPGDRVTWFPEKGWLAPFRRRTVGATSPRPVVFRYVFFFFFCPGRWGVGVALQLRGAFPIRRGGALVGSP